MSDQPGPSQHWYTNYHITISDCVTPEHDRSFLTGRLLAIYDADPQAKTYDIERKFREQYEPPKPPPAPLTITADPPAAPPASAEPQRHLLARALSHIPGVRRLLN